MNASPPKYVRYDWVDFAKGICIIAVVCLYSTKFAHEQISGAGWMQYWTDFARPFRMPDFFLISGLFLYKVIDRSWREYFDRKVVHYIYFFSLWTIISLALLVMLNERQASVSQLWSMLSSWPYKMLWFIQMLPAYFIFTKLIRKLPKWPVLVIVILLQAFPLVHTNRIIIDEFWTRYVYFYVGYAFAPQFFQIAKLAQKNMGATVLAIIGWVIINSIFVFQGWVDKPIVGFIFGIAGATAIISIAALLSCLKYVDWIRYLGKNSIVVYLVFYWPMRLAAWFLLLLNETIDPGVYVFTITIVGILGSIALFWLVNLTQIFGWLFKRPQWTFVGNY